MANFERFQPFPYDRHDGRGFDRKDEVDIEKVKRHYEEETHGHGSTYSILDEIEELVPADDD